MLILLIQPTQQKSLVTVAHDTAIIGETRIDIPWRFGDLTVINLSTLENNVEELLGGITLPHSFVRPTAVVAHAMALGDVNSDGLTDVVVADYIESFILFQNAEGTFDYSVFPMLTEINFNYDDKDIEGVQNARILDLHLSDVDNDFATDLIVGWGDDSVYSRVLLNDGFGHFNLDNSTKLPEPIYGIENSKHMKTFSEDFDQDGDEDLVFLYTRNDPFYVGNALQFFENDGDGIYFDNTHTWFGDVASYPETFLGRLHWTDYWQIKDINKDGLLDIVGHTPRLEDGTYSILIYGNRFGQEFARISIEDSELMPVAWQDFNDDGNIEFVGIKTIWGENANTVIFQLVEINNDILDGFI